MAKRSVLLRVQGIGEMSVNIEEGDSRKLFAQVAMMLSEFYTDTEQQVEVVEDDPIAKIYSEVAESLARDGEKYELKESEGEVEVPKRWALDSIVRVPEEEVEEVEDRGIVKLMFYECRSCGKLQYMIGQDGDVAQCQKCTENVSLSGAYQADYECECGQTQTVWVKGLGMAYVHCKACRKDVEIEYL